MTPQQQAILTALQAAPDWVRGPDLMDRADVGTYAALRVQIHNLRKAGVAIESRKGFRVGGYRLAAPDGPMAGRLTPEQRARSVARRLDSVSRRRALSDRESVAMERAMRMLGELGA